MKKEIEKAHDTIKNHLPKIKKYMQTYAEAKIQEGRKEGISIGEKRGEKKK